MREGKCFIETIYNTYLSGYENSIGSDYVRQMNHLKSWEFFHVEKVGDYYAFKAHNGKYISAWDDESALLKDHLKGWEKFTIISADEKDTYYVLSYHGKYMTAWNDGENIKFGSDKKGNSEKFKISFTE
jgi:hypothetical protein